MTSLDFKKVSSYVNWIVNLLFVCVDMGLKFFGVTLCYVWYKKVIGFQGTTKDVFAYFKVII